MKRLPATTVYYGLSVGLRLPTWVVMSVYLVRELHLSPLQLVLMGTAMEAAVFLFEIPTGVVADTYSRRLSLIIGFLGMGTAWIAVGLVSEPWIVILLWALWGVSYTFTSGAYEAWLADEVGAENLGTLFLRGRKLGYLGAVTGLALQVGVGTQSLRAGVIVGGAFTLLCALVCIFVMPETGFRRKPRSERASAVSQLRSQALSGARFAWATPIVLLLIGVELFMGMSSEAFDRLKEAHFLRDVGLPAVGHLDPVVWFGIFWLVGMVFGYIALGRLIRRLERGGRTVVAHYLFGFTFLELVAMFVFALSGSAWLAIAALLGVFLARGSVRGFRGFEGRKRGAGREQRAGDERSGVPQARAKAHRGRGNRVPAPLVHGHRGAPEELRRHAERDRGCARRRHGLRWVVDHGLQRDRGVGHGRNPGSGDLHADALERGRDEGRADDLRRRHSGRAAVRGRPALRPPPRAGSDAGARLRHLQRRPRARVLPLPRRQRHRNARRGWLLRDDDDGRG